MDTGGFRKTPEQATPHAWHGIVLALGALLASGLLLGAWMGALAAPATDSAPAIPPRDPLAPTAADYDFGVTKSQVPLTFTVGSNNKYYINVSGIITTTANNPSVVDVLPDGMTLEGAVNAQDWDCSLSTAEEVSCIYDAAITAVPAGDPPKNENLPPIIFSVKVSSSISPTVVQNTAKLTSEADRDPNNNTSTVTTVIDSVDLEITKEYTPTLIFPGDLVTFTMVIGNYGPVVAKNVKVTDKLSTYLTYVSSASDPPSPFVYNTSTGVWEQGDMDIVDNGGFTRTLTIVARAKSDSIGKSVVNTAKIESDNKSDWDTSDNQKTVSFSVGWIDIKKEVVPTTKAYVGEDIVFKITVKNIGARNAANVILSDDFADYLDFISDSASKGSNIFIGSTLENNLGTLTPGQSATIQVTVQGKDTLKDIKTLTNSASAEWDDPELIVPDSKLNRTSNTVSLQLIPAANLVVKKGNGASTVSPEQIVEYTITVSNTGTLPAENVVIEDSFTNDLSYESDNTDGTIIKLIDETTQSRKWKLKEPLKAGKKISFKLRLKVSEDAALNSYVKNTVKATTTTTQIRMDDDSAADSDKVIPMPKLSISYSVQPTFAEVGDTLTFKVKLVNSGEAAIDNIEVADGYPGVLDLSSASATAGTVTTNSSARSWLWKIPSLAKNKDATLTIVTKVNSTATDAETYKTAAQMKFDPDGKTHSNTVAFRVLPEGTLPGTGLQADAAGERWSWLSQATFGAAAALGLLGLAALGAGLWARARRPLWAAWYGRAGLALLLVSLVFGAGACGMGGLQVEPQELAALSGEKPPLASALPTLRPSPTHLPSPTATLQPEAPGEVEIVANPSDLDIYLPTPTPSQLPDYPIPTPSITAVAYPGIQDPESSTVTRIVIPTIGVDTVVKYVPYSNDSDTWLIGGLKQEVAWMGDTSWPGLGGNTGLAGHIDLADGSAGPFWRLSELKPGDEVILYTEKNIYTYQAREQVVVDDHDMSVIAPTDKPQLTLITCTGWDALLRIYVQRLVVFSDLVEVQPIAQ
ncbi:MAG: DUF11 domain-containing protein [Anaerolineales bacterium]|nr:DUF11 domain-containing protein [Anaerolineales bacterium]